MKRQLALGLAAVRCTLGTLGLLAPVATQRLSLLDRSDDPSTVAGWRFFGTRALALGVAYLTANDATRHHLDRAGLVVDTLDTAFLATMAARGHLRPRTAGWLALVTAGSAAIGVANVLPPDPQPRAPKSQHALARDAAVREDSR